MQIQKDRQREIDREKGEDRDIKTDRGKDKGRNIN